MELEEAAFQLGMATLLYDTVPSTTVFAGWKAGSLEITFTGLRRATFIPEISYTAIFAILSVFVLLERTRTYLAYKRDVYLSI